MLFQLVKIELFKIFKKPRTYIGFVAIAVIVGLIQLAMKVDGPTWLKLMFSGMDDMFEIKEGKILNGYFVCFLILNTLLVQVPLLVALVAGDMVAGEANLGTLRLSLPKPASRFQLMLSKFLATLFYTFLLLVWVALLSLFGSMFFFGSADNSIGPIVTTMSIIIVLTIISTMDLPLFAQVNPFLFTSYITAWKGFFNMAVDDMGSAIRGSVYSMSVILRAAAILLLHIFGFFGIAAYAFGKKDILS